MAFALVAVMALLDALPLHAAARVSVIRPDDGGAACTAHFARTSDDRVWTAPCGSRTELPDGMYDVWLERPGAITPSLTTIRVPAEREVRVDAKLAPAGEVRAVSRDSRVRLYALDVPFERLAHGATAMPSGRIVAAALDANGNVLALSKTVALAPRATVTVEPRSPERGGDVVAFVTRPPAAKAAQVSLALEGATSTRAPDVLSDTGQRILAIWYGVEDARARVIARSSTLELEPIDVVVVPKRVADVRASLRLLPSIDVSIATPEKPIDGKLTLAVRPVRSSDELRELQVETGQTVRIEALPRGAYSVALLVPGGEIETEVDLSAGVDAAISMVPEPLIVSGTVTYGGDPARARVSFRLSRSRTEAETGDDGRYELVLWQPRMYEVLTSFADRPDAPPLLDVISVRRDTTYDVRLPKTDVRVHVVDARTHAPIEGATVAMLNAWGGTSERAEHRQVQTFRTPASGTVQLPPLRSGAATLHVRADGYASAKARQLTIAEELIETFEVPLEREDAGKPIAILLPDGTPAAGAEVMIAGAKQPAWQGSAGADGKIAIPQTLAGATAFIRHPATAGAVRTVSNDGGAWRLDPAPPPLRVHVEQWRSWPEPVEITAWIDGLAVSGAALRFLAGTSPSVPSDGIWTASRLPAGPLRIIAVRARGALPLATREAMATTVPFPWPAEVVLRVADPF